MFQLFWISSDWFSEFIFFNQIFGWSKTLLHDEFTNRQSINLFLSKSLKISSDICWRPCIFEISSNDNDFLFKFKALPETYDRVYIADFLKIEFLVLFFNGWLSDCLSSVILLESFWTPVILLNSPMMLFVQWPSINSDWYYRESPHKTVKWETENTVLCEIVLFQIENRDIAKNSTMWNFITYYERNWNISKSVL